MNRKTYEAGLESISKTNLGKFNSMLARSLPKQTYIELIKKLEKIPNWEDCSLVYILKDYEDVNKLFRNYSEAYDGLDSNYGLSNKVSFWLCNKESTKPGEAICAYKKNSDMKYQHYEDLSTLKTPQFHVDYILVWGLETNNALVEHPIRTPYGKGIKHLIYVYIPNQTTLQNSALIRKEQAQRKGTEKALIESIKKTEKENIVKVLKKAEVFDLVQAIKAETEAKIEGIKK